MGARGAMFTLGNEDGEEQGWRGGVGQVVGRYGMKVRRFFPIRVWEVEVEKLGVGELGGIFTIVEGEG